MKLKKGDVYLHKHSNGSHFVEYEILEISPSGRNIKILCMNNYDIEKQKVYWTNAEDAKKYMLKEFKEKYWECEKIK